jgi:hypothetical protein
MWGAVLGVFLFLGASAGVAENDRGSVVIDSVDLARERVVLGGVSYAVVDATVLEDEYGQRTSLAELPSLASGASPDAAAVWFETATASRGMTPVLSKLRLTGSLPR